MESTRSTRHRLQFTSPWSSTRSSWWRYSMRLTHARSTDSATSLLDSSLTLFITSSGSPPSLAKYLVFKTYTENDWNFDFISLQIVIIQFGGFAFSTSPLSLEQWIWCIFFGLGTLVWQQIITTIPNSCIPKSLSYVTKKSRPFVITIFKLGLGFSRYGREPPPEPTSPINLSGNEVGHHHHHHHHHHESFSSSRSGQILWIRGLTRLQTQVGQVHPLFLCFSISSPTLSFDFFSLSIVYSEKKRVFFYLLTKSQSLILHWFLFCWD